MSNDEFVFTYENYRATLSELLDRGYTFTTYGDQLEEGEILLRHDIDLSIGHAVRMAEIESELGITATYLPLLTSPAYNVFHSRTSDALDQIQSLGHDIGLHFSTHEYWSDNPGQKALEDRVCKERELLQLGIGRDIEVVSFHIPPNWVLREQFGRFTSTYEKKFFTEIPYRGDSNQRWRDTPPFADGYPDRMQILVHPGLWDKDDASFEQRIRSAQTERTVYLAKINRRQFIDDELSDWPLQS